MDTKDNHEITTPMTELNHSAKDQIVELGDMQLHYVISEQGMASWTIIPSCMEGKI